MRFTAVPEVSGKLKSISLSDHLHRILLRRAECNRPVSCCWHKPMISLPNFHNSGTGALAFKSEWAVSQRSHETWNPDVYSIAQACLHPKRRGVSLCVPFVYILWGGWWSCVSGELGGRTLFLGKARFPLSAHLLKTISNVCGWTITKIIKTDLGCLHYSFLISVIPRASSAFDSINSSVMEALHLLLPLYSRWPCQLRTRVCSFHSMRWRKWLLFAYAWTLNTFQEGILLF